MKKTAFNNIHKKFGAKLVDFAGYEMPVQYEGIIAEHKAVRESVGVFDVSHMGEVEVRGKDAFDFVQRITTNDVSKLETGDVQYSAMCLKDGGIVDDLLVYNCGDHYMLVINASNIDKDIKWMQENLSGDVTLKNISDETSLLAVQGKNSLATLQKLTDINLSEIEYYKFVTGNIAGQDAIISHTGYTGEKVCFELYTSSDIKKSEDLWNAIFEAGKEFGIKPAGLGARDTLRLEHAFRLYGNDMDETNNTIEAGLGWITKADKGDFNGKDAVIKAKETQEKKLVGFIVEDRSVARHGQEVFSGDKKIGVVTSGSMSPMLNKNIGLAYIDKGFNKTGTPVEIAVRDKKIKATITKTPFI
ncbi:MAG: glycine cleavage system aminomethyltransferase GcvT [Ignavibacteria bacterium]|nr:glycine cleavage system aminomethyltransferase GcvT [Ignavibacteria bacterium]MBK8383150.1 glycine cleavage system aminomethyltransferase GcvT [Ignavibacteria bacterium]